MKKIVILLSLFLNVLVLSELGLNKPSSTNGEPNFDKILNKIWSFDDTEIIIKIDKKGDYYYAYDTKLKKIVILDPKDLRLIY